MTAGVMGSCGAAGAAVSGHRSGWAEILSTGGIAGLMGDGFSLGPPWGEALGFDESLGGMKNSRQEEGIAPGVLFVRGRNHLELFEEVVEKVQRSLIIEVPWILGRAGREFAARLPQLLCRGVAVSVFYGYSDSDERNDQELVERFRYLLGARLMRLCTHEKVVVVDNDLAIIGSWNWLSNGHPRHRREISVLLRGEAAQAIAGDYEKLEAVCHGNQTESMQN